MHPRSLHRDGIDFRLLTKASPDLAAFVFTNEWGTETIDFSDPAAIKSLNAAFLKSLYGVARWDLPQGYLCPSIPGRADYVHCVADLLAASNGGVIPRGPGVRVLDVGVGANCVYPLLGNAVYGWRFVGSDIDPAALASAQRIVDSNPHLKGAIELRLQKAPAKMLAGLFSQGEQFHASLSNPPFHASAREAEEGARRKWRNLGKPGHAKSAERTAQRNQRPTLNFGGQARELWCPGGERAFIAQLITESARDPGRCVWFTSLVSKSDSLKSVQHALRQARAQATETIEMKQGQKTSRLVAWTFLSPRERTERLRVQPPATSEAEACANRRSPAAPRRSRSARGPPRG